MPQAHEGFEVISFLDDILSPKGANLAEPIGVAINNAVQQAQTLGFTPDKASRAIAMWLIDLGWNTLKQTSVTSEAMLLLRGPSEQSQRKVEGCKEFCTNTASTQS